MHEKPSHLALPAFCSFQRLSWLVLITIRPHVFSVYWPCPCDGCNSRLNSPTSHSSSTRSITRSSHPRPCPLRNHRSPRLYLSHLRNSTPRSPLRNCPLGSIASPLPSMYQLSSSSLPKPGSSDSLPLSPSNCPSTLNRILKQHPFAPLSFRRQPSAPFREKVQCVFEEAFHELRTILYVLFQIHTSAEVDFSPIVVLHHRTSKHGGEVGWLAVAEPRDDPIDVGKLEQEERTPRRCRSPLERVLVSPVSALVLLTRKSRQLK